jgi:transcriptional regulator with XRE-family HTH domain
MRAPENINQRISTLVSYFGLSQKEFADECGLHQQAINRLTKDPKANPGGKMLINIKKRFPLISADWIIFGEGDMIKGAELFKPIRPIVSIPKHAYGQYKSPSFDKVEQFDNFPIYNDKPTRGFELQAFTIESKNMEPAIRDGDEVLCKLLDPTIATKLAGEVVFVVSNSVMGLYCISQSSEGVVLLSSKSPIFPPIKLNANEITEMWLYLEFKSARDVT